MAESKIPTAEKIAEWKRTIADPNVKEFAKEPLRNLLAKFGEAEVEVVKEVEKVVTPKGTRGRKPSATKKTTAKKPTGATRGRKPSTPKSQSDIESAKAELKKKFGKTEEECEKIIDQYKALRSTAKKDEVKKQEATATNRTRIEKLKKDDNIIVGTDVKTADATIETAKEEVVAKIEQEIEIVTDKAETEATKVVEKDTTLTPTEKKEKVKKVVEKEVKDKTKVIVKRVIVDTSALLTAISSKLGEFDKDSQKEFLIKLRSDIDKLLTKYAFGGDVMGATQRMNITQSNMSSSSVNSFGKGGTTKSTNNRDNNDLKIGDSVSWEQELGGGYGKNIYYGKVLDIKNDVVYIDHINSNMKNVTRQVPLHQVKKEYVRGGSTKSMYADGGLVEMFTANDDSDYVDDVLEQIKHLYNVDDIVLQEIVNYRDFDDVDELQMYFENDYFIYADSIDDLGQEYVEMLGSISELGQDTLERYFDYRAFGRDLAYDYDEYSGHYFNPSRRYDNGGGVDSKMSYKEFSETLRDNDKINIYTGQRTTGMQMFYLPNGHSSLGRKFNHKNKRKAYQEYLADAKFDNGGGVDAKFGGGGVVVYDNEGETYDRYTIFTPDGSVYGMSDNPMSPNGFNQYLGDNTEITMGSHLGKRLSEIPSSITIAVGDRMED